MRTRLLLPAAAATLALTLGACSSNSTSSSSTTTAAPGTTAGTSTTAAPGTTKASPGTTAAGDEAAMKAKLATLLATADDLGKNFTEATYTESTEPGPCGVSVDATNPPSVQAGVEFESSSDKLAFQQVVRIYSTDSAAQAAFAAGQESLSCGTSTDGTLTISTPTDVSSEVGTDAFAVTVKSSSTEGVIVAAVYSDLITTYQFQGATGAADAAGAPDPLQVAATNFSSIKATIG